MINAIDGNDVEENEYPYNEMEYPPALPPRNDQEKNEMDQEQYDLDLGIALSLSLENPDLEEINREG